MFELPVSPFTREIFAVLQNDREGVLPRRHHPLQASRDARNQTKRVVCRSVVLIPGPRFLPQILPINLVSEAHSWPSRSIDGTLFALDEPQVVDTLCISFPRRLGDCSGQRGTSLLPCISSLHFKKAHCVMPADITKCCVCSKVKLSRKFKQKRRFTQSHSKLNHTFERVVASLGSF